VKERNKSLRLPLSVTDNARADLDLSLRSFFTVVAGQNCRSSAEDDEDDGDR
jgi:hypothetical protein